MLNLIRRKIHPSEVIPRGWGIAYWYEYNQTGVMYPIPLNVVITFLRNLYCKLTHYSSKDKISLLYRDSIREAYTEGYNAGIKNEILIRALEDKNA